MFRRYKVSSPMNAKEPTWIPVSLYSNACIYYWYHVRLCNVVQHISSDWPVDTTKNDVAIKSRTVSSRMLYFHTDRVNNKASIGCVFLQGLCRNICFFSSQLCVGAVEQSVQIVLLHTVTVD